MAHIKQVNLDSGSYLIEPTLYAAATVSSDGKTYTASFNTNFELDNGVCVQIKCPNKTNTAPTTFNTKNIYYNGEAIASNTLKANHTYALVYDGTQWQLVGDIDTNTWRPVGTGATDAAAGNHGHGNISNGGALSAANQAVVTDGSNKITTEDLSSSTPTASGTATSFVTGITQNAKGKLTSITKANLPTASDSVAGITKLGATGGAATYGHTHGNINNNGTIGTANAIRAVVTNASNQITTDNFAQDSPVVPTSGTTTSLEFIDTVSQGASGKITATKKKIPNVSKDTAGLAPKGAAVSTQSQSTKFLREDGSWAVPSYTENTDHDTKVTQTGVTDNQELSILLKNTNNTTDETTSIKYGKTTDKLVTVNPSTGKISAAVGNFGGNMTIGGNLNFSTASRIDWDSGTVRQRLLITDDSTTDTAVFTFQQSTNTGNAYTNLFTIKDNGTVVATTFSGSGASLTNLPAGQLTGTIDAARLPTSGATAGSYGPSAAVTGSNNTTMDVPYITVDTYGRITSISNKVYTAVNTWRGIQNNLTSSTNTTESLSAKQGYLLANGSARDNTKVLKSGDTMTGTLNLTPASGEGGEIHLNASTAQTAQAGIVLDQQSSTFRIFGIASADGTSKTGTGTPLVIDPYAKTITGGYTITGTLDGNASTATTATNLAAKPSLAANGNNITVTAGGKTSDAFTVPYATTAGTANAVAWSNVSNKPATATRWPKWSEVTEKATTLSGYGITDAKIASGIITLGSNTITPITNIADLTGSTITAADLRTNLGLTAALRFIGKATTDISESTTTAPTVTGVTNYIPEVGDVVLDKNSDAEYVCIAKTTTNNTTTYTWELLGRSGSWATSSHTHGNITNGGLLGTANMAVVTDGSKKITTADLSVTDANASTSATTTFVQAVTQNAQGKITVTKAALDTSGTWSGTASLLTAGESTGDVDRPIWFSYQENNTAINGKLGYNDNFTYNPSSKTLKFSAGATLSTTGTDTDLTLSGKRYTYLTSGSTMYISNADNTSLIFRRGTTEYARFNTQKGLVIGGPASGTDVNSGISEKLYVNGTSKFLNTITATGQIKTSFKNSIAIGSYGSSQTTVPNLIAEVKLSSGCMGSANITTAYTLNNVTIPTGWYNFEYIPHRSGGVNGAASGDNCNYGVLYLHRMNGTEYQDYVISFDTSTIKKAYVIGGFKSTITDGQVVISDGTLGAIKTSGYTIAKSVPSDAVFTDHYAWTDITGKPDTYPPTIGTTNTTAMAGNTNVNNVTQGTSTTESWRKIILAGGDAQTAWNTAVVEKTSQVYQAVGIAAQPSTGTLRATILQGGSFTLRTNKLEYQGTKQKTTIIECIDNTTGTDGNGIRLIGGGVTIIGSGESAANFSPASAGTEVLYLLSDNQVYIEGNGQTIANRLGLQIDTSGHLLPTKAEGTNNNAQNLGASANRWKNIYGTVLNLNVLTGGSYTAASDKGEGVSPRYFPAKWTFNAGITAANGDIITIKIPGAGSTYGDFLSVDNGTHYYPVSHASTSRLTTHFAKDVCITLQFDSTGYASDVFKLNGSDARVASKDDTDVGAGVWRVLSLYDSGNDSVYQQNTTGNADYRILLSQNANDTTQTTYARKNTNLKYNPSTQTLKIGSGTLTATNYSGNADTATTLETSRKIWGNSFDGSADIAGDLDWDSDTYRQRIHITDDSTANTAVFTFQQSTDSGSTYPDLFTIYDNKDVRAWRTIYSEHSIWGGSYTKNTAQSAEHDVGARSGAGKIYLWSAAATTGNRGIWLINADESTSSTLFTVNQSNQISNMATIACRINVAYTNTGTDSASPMIKLTDNATATTAASGKWMWGVDHLVPNLATGGHTCLITGVANSTNKAAVLEFNYNNASTLTANTVGLGLYGNNGLLTIDGNGQVSITKATDATSTTNGVLKVVGGISVAKAIYMGGKLTIANSNAGAIYLGRTGAPNWIQAGTNESIAFCVNNSLAEANATLKITGSAVTSYIDENASLGTSTVQWNGAYSKSFMVDKKVTLQWNTTDQSLDFIFS